jgi:hypothetical protein
LLAKGDMKVLVLVSEYWLECGIGVTGEDFLWHGIGAGKSVLVAIWSAWHSVPDENFSFYSLCTAVAIK